MCGGVKEKQKRWTTDDENKNNENKSLVLKMYIATTTETMNNKFEIITEELTSKFRIILGYFNITQHRSM